MIPDTADINQETGQAIINGITYDDLDDYYDCLAPISD